MGGLKTRYSAYGVDGDNDFGLRQRGTNHKIHTRDFIRCAENPFSAHAPKYLCKLMVIGDKRTGKTSLVSRFKGGPFPTSYLYTIAVEFSVRYVQIDNEWIKIQIWDMAGDMDHWPTSVSTCFQCAQGVAIVYDTTDKRTFENVPKWFKEVDSHRESATGADSSDLKVILIGNKGDLTEQQEVDYSTARKYADEIGIPFMEVSAKDGCNVELAFVTVLADIMSSQQAR